MNRILWVGVLLTILHWHCEKTDPAPGNLSGENYILSVTVNGSPVAHRIDNALNRVTIHLPSHTGDIKNLGLRLEVSPKASVPFGYTDFSIPQTYSIVAENGDIRTYKVVVSQLNMYWKTTGSPEPIAIPSDYCTQTLSGFFRLNLGCGPNDPTTGVFRDHVLIDFRNQSPSTLEAGTWNIGAFPAHSVNVSFGKNNGSSLRFYTDPVAGTAYVSQVNRDTQTCSGSIGNATFNVFQQPTGEYYFLSGNFYNVPFN